MSAFFYGYIITQVPGGWLANRYGGKKVLGYGIFITALFTGLTPIAARTHVVFLIAVRILAGFGEVCCICYGYQCLVITRSQWLTQFASLLLAKLSPTTFHHLSGGKQ